MATYNLADVLTGTADEHPDRLALVAGPDRLTYANLDAASSRVANLLVDLGLERGQTVALSCPNVPAFSQAYFGILKAGGTVVPLNIMLKRQEISQMLRDSNAAMYLCLDDDTANAAEGRAAFDATASCEVLFVDDSVATTFVGDLSEDRPPIAFGAAWRAHDPTFDTVETDEDDTAVVLFTSGSSGTPKGAELRHRNLRANIEANLELTADPDAPLDVLLCSLPLYHSFGQTCIQNAAFSAGGTVVLQRRFDAREAVDLIHRESVTFFSGVPTMFWQLLAVLEPEGQESHGNPVPTLRVATSGGAPLPLEIRRVFQERYGVGILEGYGLSETAPTVTCARLGEVAPLGSVGRPIPGVEVRLIDDSWNEIDPDRTETDPVGEIAVRGPNVMKGYLGRPEQTAETIVDGWLRTGDLARRDADGFYYIVGRSKELILRGGYNVYPREIEEAFMTHPAVSLIAVVGVPDERHGEEVRAVVVLEPGNDTTSDELIAWGRENLAAYKYPRIIEIVDSLPMTSTGKILKRAL